MLAATCPPLQALSIASPDAAEATIYAQTVPVTPSRPESQGPVSLAEIVVTGEPWPEDRQRSAIAAASLSGVDLDESAMTGFDEIAQGIPNVSFNTDFNSLYVRGIGTSELNVLSEQAVSYVLDGVYVPRLDYLKPGLMDVERIDIIKGPQGMLLARSAAAGLIDVRYREPTEEWASYAAFTSGSNALRKAEAALSGPFTDDLGFRLAGSWLTEDGHTSNLVDGSRIGDRDVRQARIKLRSALTDDLHASFGASYFEYLIGVWGGSEAFEYPQALRPVVALLDPSFETVLDRHASANNQNLSRGRGLVMPLKFDLDVAGHKFSSTTSYSSLDDTQGGDVDGSGAALADLRAELHSHVWSQDLRLASPRGATEYLAGVSLYRSRLSLDVDYRIGVNPGSETLSGALSAAALSRFVDLGALDAVTAMLFPGDALDTLNGRASIEVRSLGLFAEITRHLGDSLSLSLGGRYSRDARQGFGVVADQGPVPIWSALVLGGYSTTRRNNDEAFSPKLALAWRPGKSVTLYANHARGFRAGSFNAGAFSESDFEFRPERSSAYEAGLQATGFAGRLRLSLAGFWMDYHDYQLAVFNGFGYSTANAEQARTVGMESSLQLQLMPGLVAMAVIGHSAARFVEYRRGGCPTMPLGSPGGWPPQGIGALPPQRTCDLSGRPLFRAPDWSGNLGVRYRKRLPRWPVGVLFDADAAYKGFEYMDPDLDPLDTQAGYWLYSAQVGVHAADDRWAFVINGKNLSDRLVKTFSGDIPLQAGAHWALTNPPRTVSATLRLNF